MNTQRIVSLVLALFVAVGTTACGKGGTGASSPGAPASGAASGAR